MMSSNTLGNTDFNPINGVVPPPKGKATLQKDDKLKLAPSQPDKFEKTTASPRKTAEATLTKQAEETPTPVATKQGNQWLLPVAGSCVGVLLAIGAFFVGKGQAEKEAGEMIGKAAGETGKSLTDLGAKAGEVATEMPKAIKKQLQGLLL